MINNKYFSSLDFFRGFCGYGVAISHLHAFAFNNIFSEYISLLFVEFFFVLSGFVLYPQLLKVLNNSKNLVIFFKRRWLRTLPLFFIILFAVSALTGNLFNSDFFKYLFLIQKTFPGFINDDYYPVAWSLSIEEFYYLAFPMILIFLNKNNFIQVTIFLIIIIQLLKFSYNPYFETNFYRTGTFLRFDAILLGFVIAHFINRIFHYKKSCSLILFSLTILYLSKYDYFISNQDNHLIRFLFIIFLQILSVLTLIFFLQIENLFKNIKLKKFSKKISQQTYSIYLFHIILIYLIDKIETNIFAINIIYIFTLFVVSTFIYDYIEKPILRKRPKLN
tara:strand:+ start:2940 stop:3941 length:1002 start_codon:yes stop_codon:yes gene_type:complete